MHWSSIIQCLLLVPSSALAQTTSTDAQTLQALLVEVRELRKDLRTTTVAVEGAQILLYRLHEQELAVTRASQCVENTRQKLVETQAERKKLAATIKQFETDLGQNENPSPDRKQIEEVVPQLKARLQSLETEEQQRLTSEMEAEDQMRAAQYKLTELSDQLDRLQRTLESLGQQAGSNLN